MRCFLLLILFFTSTLQAEGFVVGTLVQTQVGFVPIEQLCSGDCVKLNNKNQSSSSFSIIVGTAVNNAVNYIKITLKDGVICTASDQKFYVPKKGWVKAEELVTSDVLLCANRECINIDAIEVIQASCKLHTISVESHMFCITTYGIIVHNAEPIGTSVAAIVLPICPPLSGAIFLGEIIAFGATIVTTYLIHKKSKQKHNNENIVVAGSGGCPCGGKPPKHENDEDEHPHGVYEDAGYHHKNSGGRKSRCPNDGQKCLDTSLPVFKNTTVRINVEDGKFVILRQSEAGKFHGYVIDSWEELCKEGAKTQPIRNAFQKHKFVNQAGKIIK